MTVQATVHRTRLSVLLLLVVALFGTVVGTAGGTLSGNPWKTCSLLSTADAQTVAPGATHLDSGLPFDPKVCNYRTSDATSVVQLTYNTNVKGSNLPMGSDRTLKGAYAAALRLSRHNVGVRTKNGVTVRDTLSTPAGMGAQAYVQVARVYPPASTTSSGADFEVIWLEKGAFWTFMVSTDGPSQPEVSAVVHLAKQIHDRI